MTGALATHVAARGSLLHGRDHRREDADHLAHVVDLDVVKPMRNRVLDLVVRTRPAVVEPCRRELEAEPIARATSCAAVAEDATAGERRRDG